VFDIVPVKDKNEALKKKYTRSLLENSIATNQDVFHVIHKRAATVTSTSTTSSNVTVQTGVLKPSSNLFYT
jgi:hypothetical protein